MSSVVFQPVKENPLIDLSEFINTWAIGVKHIAVEASSNGLILPSLRKLAYVGFSLPVLQFMERNALRAAAQLIKARQAIGAKTTVGDVQTYVGIDLAGEHYDTHQIDAVTPGHLKSYAEAKTLIAALSGESVAQQLKPALAALLEIDALDQATQLGTADGAAWLADHVLALEAAALKYVAKTPSFANLISTRANFLITHYPHQDALRGSFHEVSQRLESLRDAMHSTKMQ